MPATPCSTPDSSRTSRCRRGRAAVRRPGRLRPGRRQRALPRVDREPAVPLAGRGRTDLPHGHAARRPGARPVGVRVVDALPVARWCSGVATVLDGDAKLRGLERVSEHLMPGRWADARQPNRKELAATLVLALPLDGVVGEGQRRAAGRRGGGPRAAGLGRRAAAARDVRRAERRAGPARTAWTSPGTSATGRAGDGAAAGVPLAVVVARHRRRRLHPAAVAAGRPRRRRRDRRRRVHRPLDGLLPRGCRPVAADRGAGARGGGLRRERSQRRLVLGAVPRLRRLAGEAVRRRPARSRSTAPCRDAVDEVGRVADAEGIDCHFGKGGTVVAGADAGAARPGPGRGRRGTRGGASATTT